MVPKALLGILCRTEIPSACGVAEIKEQVNTGMTDMIEETYYGMRIDTFLAEDPIAPMEDMEVENTEEEKEQLCKRILDFMNIAEK